MNEYLLFMSVVRGGGERVGGASSHVSDSLRRYMDRVEPKPPLSRRRVSRLLSDLKSVSPIVRYEALKSLVLQKEKRVVRRVPGFLSDLNHNLRKWAVRAVAVFKLWSDDVIFNRVVNMLLHDENARVRYEAAVSLAESGRVVEARDFLRTAARTESNTTALWGVCDALGRLGTQEDIFLLASLRRFESERLNHKVNRALGNIAHVDAFPVLFEMLDSKCYESAAWALSRVSHASKENGSFVFEKLTGMLNDADPGKRECAAYALGFVSTQKVVNWAVRVIKNKLGALRLGAGVPSNGNGVHDRVFEGAVYACTWINSSAVVPLLLKCLKVDSHVRDMALFVLGVRMPANAESIPLLCTFLGDEALISSESFMSRAVWWELVKEPKIFERGTPSRLTRSYVVEQALYALAKTHHDEVISHAVEVYNSASSDEVRDAALRLLAIVHKKYLMTTPHHPPENKFPNKNWGSETFTILTDNMGWTEMEFKPRVRLKLKDVPKRGSKRGKLPPHVVEEGGTFYFCHCTSFHMHTQKEVGIDVVSGTVKIVYGHDKREVILTQADSPFKIAAGVPHQIINVGDTKAEVHEVETPAHKNDIIRFSSPYKTPLKLEGY